MNGPLLLLYWPDFADHSGYRADVFAMAVRDHLCRSHGSVAGYVWDPDEAGGPVADSAFRRAGLGLITDPWSPALARQLALAATDPPILAMSGQRAADVGIPDAAIWVPDEAFGREERAKEVLGLGRMHTVGLFIREDAFPGLAGYDRQQEIRRVLSLAALVGTLTTAEIADDCGRCRDLLDPGEPERPLGLQEAVASLLLSPRAPNTIILMAGDRPLEPVIRHAHSLGVRVMVWHGGPHPACAQLADLQADISAFGVSPRRPALVATRPTSEGLNAEVAPESYSLGVWPRFAYWVERAAPRPGAPAPASSLLASLATAGDGEFGPGEESSRQWLTRAEALGLIRLESDDGAALVHLEPHHAAARAAREVPDRIIRLLARMLQKIPWVSFKLLRTLLQREQWLGGPPYRLFEEGVDEWLNYLIAEGVLGVSRQANLVNPDHPVTAVHLSDGHPLVRHVLLRMENVADLASERIVLAIDHFLIRQRKPWMAMSVLRRRMADLGRDELQAALQALHMDGAVHIDAYPNPQRDHPTTGCRVDDEHPLVRQTLMTRDDLVRSLAHADISAAEECVGGAGELARWLPVLVDEGLIESGAGTPRPCRDDVVVRQALDR